MKYLRAIHFLFIFSLALLVLSVAKPRHVRLPDHAWIGYCILSVLCLYFGYFSYRSLRADLAYARGPKCFERHFALKITPKHSSVLIGPISGQGQCQLRLDIQRISEGASADEFEISKVSTMELFSQIETSAFTFNKAAFEMNIAEASTWIYHIQIRPLAKLNETFIAKAQLVVFGHATDVRAPDEVVQTVS